MTSSAVDRVKQDYSAAVAEERRLQQAVVDGDQTITAGDLAEAAGAVQLAALRVQAAERIAADEDRKRFDAAQAARLARREKRAEEDRRLQRESWQRAIDSGAAARHLEAHRMNGVGPARPHLPKEYEAMLVEAGLLPPLERQEATR